MYSLKSSFQVPILLLSCYFLVENDAFKICNKSEDCGIAGFCYHEENFKISVCNFDYVTHMFALDLNGSCTKIINACESQKKTCLNGGSCVPVLGSLFCVCPPGYYGLRCSRKYPGKLFVYFVIFP